MGDKWDLQWRRVALLGCDSCTGSLTAPPWTLSPRVGSLQAQLCSSLLCPKPSAPAAAPTPTAPHLCAWGPGLDVEVQMWPLDGIPAAVGVDLMNGIAAGAVPALCLGQQGGCSTHRRRTGYYNQGTSLIAPSPGLPAMHVQGCGGVPGLGNTEMLLAASHLHSGAAPALSHPQPQGAQDSL